MSKRCTAKVFQLEAIEDEFGGHAESLVLTQVLHGSLTSDLNNVITDEKGSNLDVITMLKVHRKIKQPTEKLLLIDGEKYRIIGVSNNIGKRFFYQLELLSGGEVYENHN